MTPRAYGFNEAAAVRLRKCPGLHVYQLAVNLASMRPQPCGCGNVATVEAVAENLELQ